MRIEFVHDKGVQTVDIRNGDPHCDQGHHGGALHFQLHFSAAEERLTAINKENRRQDQYDPLRTWESELKWQLYPHHWGKNDDRDRQNKREPKLLFEIPHMHRMVHAAAHIMVLMTIHSMIHLVMIVPLHCMIHMLVIMHRRVLFHRFIHFFSLLHLNDLLHHFI